MVGCATIANGTSQRIEVLSEPPGAEVFVAGELVGTTPTEIVMSRRSVNPRVRVVDQRGNSEYRRPGNRLSGWMWLDLAGALVLGYAVYPKFPGEENPEGSVRIGLLAALIPAAVDFTLGGAYEFPSRIDFRQRSAKGHEPFTQKPMRPMQSDRGVLRGRCAVAAPSRRWSSLRHPAASRRCASVGRKRSTSIPMAAFAWPSPTGNPPR